MIFSAIWALPLKYLIPVSLFAFYLITKIMQLVRRKPVVQRGVVSFVDGEAHCVSALAGQDDGLPEVDSVYELFESAASRFPDRPCLGFREVTERIETEKETSKGTKTFVSLLHTNYQWMTYGQVREMIDVFGRGMRALGIQPGGMAGIFASTSFPWMVTVQACMKNGVTLTTAYPNLGRDGLEHALGQTQAQLVIADEALLPVVAQAIDNLNSVTHVIVVADATYPAADNAANPHRGHEVLASHDVEVVSWGHVCDLGRETPCEPAVVSPEDNAVIMYTSGSTGLPKGVEIPHRSLAGAVHGIKPHVHNLTEEDVYVSYLPLAHILEMTASLTMLSTGARIGYSSSHTLSDTGTMIVRGPRSTGGDLRALQPTLMAAVPLVLDRIKDGVQAKIAKSGFLISTLFKWAVWSASSAISARCPPPMWTQLIFRKPRAAMGGRLRLMLSGGAAISPDTRRFFSAVFAPLGEGYGLSETCGIATITHPDDPEVGVVGAPASVATIKLVDWECYQNDDINNPEIGGPRGEICISGAHITRGYYGMPEKTAEDYEVDADGRVWFHTGDIGQFTPSGTLKIVSRKKALVKGRHGEYVSLGRVESVLRESPLVDNVMVHQTSAQDRPFAVVTPNLDKLAEALGLDDAAALPAPSDADVVAAVGGALASKGATALKKFEIPLPSSVIVDYEPWTPESDLVTAAMKLKRKNLMAKYADAILAAGYN